MDKAKQKRLLNAVLSVIVFLVSTQLANPWAFIGYMVTGMLFHGVIFPAGTKSFIKWRKGNT